MQIGVYCPYPDAIRRSAALLIVVSHFVEVVLVQLAHETGEVAVLEVLRQNVLGEFLVLRKFSQCAFCVGRSCAFFMSLPPAPQNCLLRCPIAPHSRLVGSPTSWKGNMSICTGAIGDFGLCPRHLLVELAHLGFVSERNAAAHGGNGLTKSLELFADWAAVPSMFAVVTRDNAGPCSWCKV